jgi:nucleoside-diphosphate-sugar epimerase
MQKKDSDYIISKLFHSGTLSNLSGKKILVVGGTGFVGRWFDIEGLNIIRYGKEEMARLEFPFQYYDFDYIIHAAPTPPKCTSKSYQRLLFISSGAVYDDPSTDTSIEKMLHESMVKPPHISARLFTLAGYGARPGRFALDTFIRRGLEGKPIQVYNRYSLRGYMYGADMAVRVLEAIVNETDTFCDIGSRDKIMIRNVAKIVADHFHVAVECIHGEPDPRPDYAPAQTKYREMMFSKESIVRTIEEYELCELKQ